MIDVRLAFSITLVAASSLLAEDRERFFENEIRPILVDNCTQCHGDKKQSGSLRFDSRASILAGGDSGPAIEVGNSSSSLLMQAVRRTGDLKMPPDKPLTPRQVDALSRWIEMGAYWPQSSSAISRPSIENAAGNHWAFRKVAEPNIPQVRDTTWGRTPVDAFILSKLEQQGLAPSGEADHRTLARRLYFTLTGLPPNHSDVERFASNASPQAYERLVEQLLDSPEYGRHWARHWLDIARYSDTKGYVYAREERFWVHAWTYREWVVRALNDGMPYDRFLLLQIAADQVPDRRNDDLAAMGFLTLGRRFLGVKHDIIDDRIDVVTRGTMGLTVGCARCHDHKYDPIPTADYYSLYGVFDNCSERLVPLASPVAKDEAFARELKLRQEKLSKRTAECCAESSDRVRARVGDYLRAQTELHKYPGDDFSQIFTKQDLLPAFVRQWEDYLRMNASEHHPIFAPWFQYQRASENSPQLSAANITQEIIRSSASLNPIVVREFALPCKNLDEVIRRYANLFREIDHRWKLALATVAQRGESSPGQLPDFASEQLRQVLYGVNSPCEIKDQAIVYSESFFDLGTCTELWKLQGEVDRWINSSKPGSPHAVALFNLPTDIEPRIFRRGNALQKAESVPRQFLGFLTENRQPFRSGSERMELAQAIIDPTNPLTARVIVNRVWAWHFGRGLVTTPSDFGLRAEMPSHPELLNWLASRFVAEGWNLKKLHRWLLTSSTFRQSSAVENTGKSLGLEFDPQNRLLWRMNDRRLSFEEYRDALLNVSGQLQAAADAKPVNLFAKPFPTSRTIYGLVDRQFLPATLRTFDFANPDLHIPSRTETTVPQQALFTLNHPVILEQARALSDAIDKETNLQRRVQRLFERALQRLPTQDEVSESLDFISAAEPANEVAKSNTSADWKYGYGEVDEKMGQVKGFEVLPHFTGQAWQGGDKHPDGKLGWVQLTSAGGHPGNDRTHAAVRRWTAPRQTSIRVTSKLEHKPAAGDGVRAFIVSSRAGILHSASAHQKTLAIDIPQREVSAGETIDFVVDLAQGLNSDQFLWEVSIYTTDSPTRIETTPALQEVVRHAPKVWNSLADFTPDPIVPLNPWQQLAQILICSNEFAFVD